MSSPQVVTKFCGTEYGRPFCHEASPTVVAIIHSGLWLDDFGVKRKRMFTASICINERIFGGEAEVHDEIHIKEHMSGKINVGNLTEDQQRFYYFSMSDLNRDNRIDGIEIIKALLHDHTGKVPAMMTRSDDELVTLVDSVLKTMDLNGDGFVDYAEYFTKQKLRK